MDQSQPEQPESAATQMPPDDTPVVKRGPGRPRKTPKPPGTIHGSGQPSKNVPAVPGSSFADSVAEPVATGKRPRGRPRKSGQPGSPTTSSAMIQKPHPTATTGKRRGRPRKSDQAETETRPAAMVQKLGEGDVTTGTTLRKQQAKGKEVDAGSDEDDTESDQDDAMLIQTLEKSLEIDFERAITGAIRWGRENPTSNGLETFLAKLKIINFKYDQDWTELDSIRAGRDWDNDPKSKAASNYTKHHGMMVLWKDCDRFWECSPFDIISVDNHLEYDIQQNDAVEIGDGQYEKVARWSQGFCRRLKTLIFHPFFDNSVSLLVTAIQFAVICRTNDAREWPIRISCEGHNHFQTSLRRTMAQPGFKDTPICQVYRLFRQMMPHGPKLPITNLLAAIGKIAPTGTQTSVLGEVSPHHPYLVRTTDLKHVEEALNSLSTTYGVPYFFDAKHYEACASVNHPKNGRPHASEVSEAAFIAGRTEYIKKQRSARLYDAGKAQQPEEH